MDYNRWLLALLAASTVGYTAEHPLPIFKWDTHENFMKSEVWTKQTLVRHDHGREGSYGTPMIQTSVAVQTTST